MEKPFRWNIFWHTIISFVFLIGLFVLLIDSGIDSKLFVGMLFLVLVGTWIGIFIWWRKYSEYLWILGIIILVFIAILIGFVFPDLTENYDEVYYITFLMFVLGYLIVLYRKKLYEILWGMIMFIFTFFVFWATLAIELIIHPPSEE